MTDRELMQQALEAMGTVGADWICEASHHNKKDQHKWGEPCPLQQRWHIAYQALRERLAQPVQEPVAWIWKDGTVTTDSDRADGTWTPLFSSPTATKPLKLKEKKS